MNSRRFTGWHPAATWSAATTLGILGVLVCAYAAVSPAGYLFKLVLLLIVLTVALALTPQSFLAASILVFAVSTSVSAPLVSALPVAVYLSDVVLLLVALRGILPRERVESARALAGMPTVLFAIWLFVMAVAAVRGMNAGVSLASAIRGESAVVYWPLLYFGFTRILREKELEPSLLARDLTLVAVGLAGWMFVARLTNHPFNDSGLALVPTGPNSYVHRNYGFAGAFTVYPVLALAGIAGMAHGGRRPVRFAILAAVGVVATLLTLVRGEIFSLALASVIILCLRPRRLRSSNRVRTALQLSLVLLVVVGGLTVASPKLGNAIVQRTLPFTHQAQGAELNAKYRQTAVQTGFRVARSHPAGRGVLDVRRLDAEKIDPGFLAHSGLAILLLFGGWPALVSAVLLIISVVLRSFSVAASPPWLHSASVAVLIMLSVYTISAAGLAGDPWVVPLGALAVAVRFNLWKGQERARS